MSHAGRKVRTTHGHSNRCKCKKCAATAYGLCFDKRNDTLDPSARSLNHVEFPQVKVPNTVPHNEAEDILRSEVQGHSDAHSQ